MQLLVRLHHGEEGHALTYLALFALGMACFVMFIVNGGEILNQKIITQNAADSTAYTMAIWDARAMNMVAMINLFSVLVIATLAMLVGAKVFLDYMFWSAIAGLAAAIAALQWGLAAKFAGEAIKLYQLSEKMDKKLEDAKEDIGPILDNSYFVADTLRTTLHMAGVFESSSVLSTGGDIGSQNHVTWSQSLGTALVPIDGSFPLPLCEGDGCSPGRKDQFRSGTEHGRLGGYDHDHSGMMSDKGKGLELGESASSMAQAVKNVQAQAGSFTSGDTGPYHSMILQAPLYAFMLVDVAPKVPYTTVVAMAATLISKNAFLEALNPDNITKAIVGTRGPLMLKDDWEKDLNFIGLAGREGVTAPLMPGLFQMGSSTVLASAQAEVYNPYRAKGDDPDMFTPQWRARLVPLSSDASFYTDVSTDPTSLLTGTIDDLFQLGSLAAGGSVKH